MVIRKRFVLRALVAILLCMPSLSISAQHLALKSNATYLATATPNLGLELKTTSKWTCELSVGYNPFSFSGNKKWKHVAAEIEPRYWLCSPFAGHFMGADLLYSHYNAGNVDLPFGIFPELKNHRFQGDLGAVGLVYGYSWMIHRRWSIEGAVGLGIGVTRYDKYLCEKCGSQVSHETRTLFMPTKLALSVVYYLY